MERVFVFPLFFLHSNLYRVSNFIPGILVCDPIPRILGIEMPGIGSCSHSAKWAWDRPGGGCHTTLMECRNGGFKERANFGAHKTRVQVQSLEQNSGMQ